MQDNIFLCSLKANRLLRELSTMKTYVSLLVSRDEGVKIFDNIGDEVFFS